MRYDGTFSGFKFGAMYGFGNVPGSMKSSSKYDFGLGYENGPFAAVATFDRQNGANDSVTPADTTNYIQGIHAGLSYDFGAVKAMAGYRNYRRTFHTSAPTLRSDMYWIGGQYEVTPFISLFAAVYHQDIKDASDADPTLFSLRAQYALSKETHGAVYGGRLCDGQARQCSESVTRFDWCRGYASGRHGGCPASLLKRFARRVAQRRSGHAR